jgi:hypothetical protein
MINVFFNFEKDAPCEINSQVTFHTQNKNTKEIRFKHKKTENYFFGSKVNGNPGQLHQKFHDFTGCST